MIKPATPEEENNPPPGFRVQYEKDPIAGTVGYLVPDDGAGNGGMSVSPTLPTTSGPRMSAAGGKKPYDLSMSLRAPEYTDAVAAMKATAGRSMPRFPVDEVDDLEEEDIGQGPMVQPAPAARPAPSAPQPQPAQGLAIPQDLLERLRAARKRDAADAGASSLGRLLMATSAGFSGVPTAPALMQDYMAIERDRRGAGRRAFAEEQDLLTAETRRQREAAQSKKYESEAILKRLEESRMNDPTTPSARLYQMIARDKLGIAPELANNLTERSGSAMLSMLKLDEGTKRALDIEAAKAEKAYELQRLNEQLARWTELTRSGDRNAKIQADLIAAAIRNAEGGRTSVEREKLQNAKDQKFLDRVTSLQKQLPKELESSIAHIQTIESIAVDPKTGKFKNNIPGVGPAIGIVPDRGLKYFKGEERGSELRKAYNSLKNDYAHAKYGGALQKNEETRMEKALADIDAANTSSEFVEGFKILRTLIHGTMGKIYRGYPDDVVAEHFRRGGIAIPGDARHGPSGTIMKQVTGASLEDKEREIQALLAKENE